MQRQAFASIDLSWATLRYAEVEHHADGVRPLRLGSCDFDFDVTRELLRTEAPTRLDVVADALSDVFAGAASNQLRVVVHPPDAYSFVTVVPKEAPTEERAERFQQEASLLAGTEPGKGLYLTASSVHAETHLDVEPVHVLAVPDDRHARFETVTAGMPHADVQWVLSTQSAAQVTTRSMPAVEEADETAITLVVGAYPEYTEYGLLRNGRWYFSHYADAEDPADVTYFATALLDQLDIARSAVARIGLYGIGANADAFTPFESVFGVAPKLINPFGVLGLDHAAIQGADFGIGAYVPCIGAAL